MALGATAERNVTIGREFNTVISNSLGSFPDLGMDLR